MLSSVRKHFILSLLAAPFTVGVSVSYAQSTPDSKTALARTSSAMATNDLFVNQWVHASADGTINGSVVALMGQDSLSLARVKVTLSQNGAVVASDETDVDGDFLIEKVTPGLYSLSAEGAGSVAIFSLAVLDEIAGKHLPNSVEVRVMPTSSRISELIRGQTIPKEATPITLTGDPLQMSRKMATTHQVMLDSAGMLNGRLGKAASAVDMSSMTVFITKDGKEISRARVSGNGEFAVQGLAPAVYGLVASGDQGVAAVGFCAVAQSVVMANPRANVLVSQSTLPRSLNIEVCDAPVAEKSQNFPTDAVAEAVPSTSVVGMAPVGMAPGMGGGFGGGTGGGGGGIGGGLGSLAGIGGLIAVGIIAADNNNNSTNTPSPIVP